MVREDKSSWKANYFLKIVQLLDEYPKCFLVRLLQLKKIFLEQLNTLYKSQTLLVLSGVNWSTIMHFLAFDFEILLFNLVLGECWQCGVQADAADSHLSGHAVVLMGKNTMMRKAIRGHLANNPKLDQLLQHIKGNIGFVFTKEELVNIRDLLLANKVRAPARAGALAPLDVVVPAQNTGLGPEKTSFFQALNIPTKITKGTIEIIQDVNLIKTGDKVTVFNCSIFVLVRFWVTL